MSSAWNYEANACSKNGKFGTKFESCEVTLRALSSPWRATTFYK
ncbi:hypothetical protein [Campylobacter concisus]